MKAATWKQINALKRSFTEEKKTDDNFAKKIKKENEKKIKKVNNKQGKISTARQYNHGKTIQTTR
jgi:hypothetical protein